MGSENVARTRLLRAPFGRIAPMTPRREYGTGSIYQRASDGRWFGSIKGGTNKNYTRLRKTVSAKTEGEVKKKLRDLAIKMQAEGKASAADPRATVKTYATRWLERTATTSRPKTYVTDKGAVEAWIIPTIGHRRLGDLEPDDVRAIAAALRKAGKSTSTARRYQGVLIRMLKAAIQDGHAIPNRTIAVKLADKAVHDRQAMTTVEALRALAVAGMMPNGCRWLIALLQGMRQGEVLGLTWDAVDFDAGTLRIEWQLQSLPYINKKNRALGFRIPDGYKVRHLCGAYHLVELKTQSGYRIIPLVPGATQALREWRDIAPVNPYGLVWATTKGRPINLRDDTKEWQAIQREAGIAHPSGRAYHVHEARHTTATLLMELRVPESVRIAIMGHSSIATTREYEWASTTEARAALEQVAERLGLGAPQPPPIH
jgi:integrase